MTIEVLNGAIEINRTFRFGPINIKFGKVELATAASAVGWIASDLLPILSAWFPW